MEEQILSQTPPNQIDAASPELISPPKKSLIIPVLMASLITTAILVGGFIFYNSTKKTPVVTTSSPIPSSTASQAPLPSTVAIDQESWNTYTNSVHNVSFKYPLGWQLTKEDDLAKLNASIKLTKDQATIHMIFGVDGIGGSGIDYEGSPFILDGNKVFKYKAHNTYDNSESIGITNSLKESLGVLMLDKKTYVINLKYPTKYIESGESINLEKTFDQILSTFKVTSINSGSKYTLEEIGNACISLQGSTKYWNTKYLECIESGTPKDQLEAFCSKYGGDFVSNASTCRHAGEEGIPCGPEATYYCGF